MNGWFLNDSLLGGTQSDLTEAAEIIREKGPALGPELSTVFSPRKSKSLVCCKSASDMGQDLLDMGITSNISNEIIHLEAPLGDEAYMLKAVGERVSKAATVMGKLVNLKDPHSKLILLHSYFSRPKVSYALRTTLPLTVILNDMARELLGTISSET